jgi:hypothetical protein
VHLSRYALYLDLDVTSSSLLTNFFSKTWTDFGPTNDQYLFCLQAAGISDVLKWQAVSAVLMAVIVAQVAVSFK